MTDVSEFAVRIMDDQGEVVERSVPVEALVSTRKVAQTPTTRLMGLLFVTAGVTVAGLFYTLGPSVYPFVWGVIALFLTYASVRPTGYDLIELDVADPTEDPEESGLKNAAAALGTQSGFWSVHDVDSAGLVGALNRAGVDYRQYRGSFANPYWHTEYECVFVRGALGEVERESGGSKPVRTYFLGGAAIATAALFLLTGSYAATAVVGVVFLVAGALSPAYDQPDLIHVDPAEETEGAPFDARMSTPTLPGQFPFPATDADEVVEDLRKGSETELESERAHPELDADATGVSWEDEDEEVTAEPADEEPAEESGDEEPIERPEPPDETPIEMPAGAPTEATDDSGPTDQSDATAGQSAETTADQSTDSPDGPEDTDDPPAEPVTPGGDAEASPATADASEGGETAADDGDDSPVPTESPDADGATADATPGSGDETVADAAPETPSETPVEPEEGSAPAGDAGEPSTGQGEDLDPVESWPPAEVADEDAETADDDAAPEASGTTGAAEPAAATGPVGPGEESGGDETGVDEDAAGAVGSDETTADADAEEPTVDAGVDETTEAEAGAGGAPADAGAGAATADASVDGTTPEAGSGEETTEPGTGETAADPGTDESVASTGTGETAAGAGSGDADPTEDTSGDSDGTARADDRVIDWPSGWSDAGEVASRLPELLSATASASPPERERAVSLAEEAAEQYPGAVADSLSVVADRLEDDDPRVRVGAIRTVGHLISAGRLDDIEEGVGPLVSCLDADADGVREAAVAVVRRLAVKRPEPFEPYLERLLVYDAHLEGIALDSSGFAAVREAHPERTTGALVESLDRLTAGDGDAGPLLDGLLSADPADALAVAGRRIKSSDPSAIHEALALLAMLAPSNADTVSDQFPQLRSLADNMPPDWGPAVTGLVITIAGMLESESPVDAAEVQNLLQRAFANPSPVVRQAGCLLLTRVAANTPDMVENEQEALAHCLADDAAAVRRIACRAVGRLEAGELCDRLQELQSDPDPTVRVAAERAVAATCSGGRAE